MHKEISVLSRYPIRQLRTSSFCPNFQWGPTRRSLTLLVVLAAILCTSSVRADQTREIMGKDGAPMALVPTGEFWMGTSPDEMKQVVEDCVKNGSKEEQCQSWFKSETPYHRIMLDAFYLDKYEVTNQLFDQFVRATGYQTTVELEGKALQGMSKAWAWFEGKGWQEVIGANWRKPEGEVSVFESDRTNHPVVSVTWDDANAYCRWAGKRLPTEAEFEYATRAGTQTRYWWGDGNPGSRRVANISDESAHGKLKKSMEGYKDGSFRTAPVGSYEANPFGLYDMIGNVAEWTADWYDEKYPVSPERNPKGFPGGATKVIRGGSWSTSQSYALRSAYRNKYPARYRLSNLGFRCAQDASAK